MAKNEFKPFATANGANVTAQADYETLPARSAGFQSGKASSAQINKAIRQATVIASVVAQFIADESKADVLDDGDVAALQQSLLAALKQNAADNLPKASTTTAGIAKLSSATDSSDESVASTPKAVKAANDNANSRLLATATAAAATKLATARTIGGVKFDGTANINLPGVDTAGNQATTGNAATATKLATARAINGVAFDGTANIDINTQQIFSTSLAIGNAADLNAYTTPGLYHQPANAQALAGSNYPEGQAGSLEVLKHAGITQIYRIYNNSRCYKRTQYSGTWSAWILDYDTANKPTAADVGALAAGGTAVAATKLATARTINGVAFDGTANISLPLDLAVGSPVPYPLATAPSGWLKCNGQAFNKTTYPQLATAYPSGVLPDLRGEFIRGWDDARGVDVGRTLLSAQGDAIRNITGKFANNGLAWAEGTTSSVGEGAFTRLEGTLPSNNYSGGAGCQYTFDASKVVPTAAENRPRNTAFNYIVRAA